jgi:hypothetical protein
MVWEGGGAMRSEKNVVMMKFVVEVREPSQSVQLGGPGVGVEMV